MTSFAGNAEFGQRILEHLDPDLLQGYNWALKGRNGIEVMEQMKDIAKDEKASQIFL